jgi:O-antigen ligase
VPVLPAWAGLIFLGILTAWVPGREAATAFECGMFALAAVTVIRDRDFTTRLPFPIFVLTFAVAWGIMQLLTGRSVYAFDTRNATVQWASYLAAFYVGTRLVEERGARRRMRAAVMWFGFVIAVLATLQTFTSGGRVFWLFSTPYADFVMGPILSRNHYAAFIEMVLPIAIYEALRRDGAILYTGIVAAMYASVIAAASRAGAVLCTLELITVPLMLGLRGRTERSAAGSALLRMAVLLAVFTAVVGPATVWERFWTPDPYAVRREFAESSLHMISAHPWTGTGLGTWATAYPAYALIDVGGFANQAHSDWLQWGAEGGIPLAAAMAALFLWLLRPAFRSIWGLGAVAVFLHAAVDYPFSRPALGTWAIVLISILPKPEATYTREPLELSDE